MTETTIDVTTNEQEDIRIPSYQDHGWMKLPQGLKDHFDKKRFGIFDVIPPMFSWGNDEKTLTLTFKWGTDISNPEIPLNQKELLLVPGTYSL